MKHTLILFVFVQFCFLSISGQTEDVLLEGSFVNVPFIEFVDSLQNTNDLRFYFNAEWIKDIRITVSGNNISLRSTLDSALNPMGINYLILEGDRIFLSKGVKFIAEIPNYSGYLLDLEGSSANAVVGLTDTERKYIFGRKLRVLDTLIVGNPSDVKGLKNAVINGKILNSENGEPLIGATIYFNELGKGAATDVDGRFSFVVNPGKYTVGCNYIGMAEKRYLFEVISSGSISIVMEKETVSLTEVVVRANKYNNIRGTQMGTERLNFNSLKEVAVVMGEKDVIKVVQMLPGVHSVGEGATGFNVRGGSHDQNLIYINKVPVYNSSHLFGFFTSFNPDIIKDFTLYKSSFPVSYGGRLASIFDITTRQGNMNKFAARGGISPVSGHIAMESPIKKGKSAIMLAGRSSYSDWLLKRLEIPVLQDSKAEFYDLSGALTWEPGDKTLIKLFGYQSNDRFTLGNTNDFEYSTMGASLVIRQRLGSRVNMNLTGSYGDYQYMTNDYQNPSQAYSQEYQIAHHEGKIDLTWLATKRHKVTFGASGIYYDLDHGDVSPFGEKSFHKPVHLGKERAIETALYAADEISLFKWLRIYGGVRYVDFRSMGPEDVMIYGEGKSLNIWNITDTLHVAKDEFTAEYSSLEPRASVNIILGPRNSFKFSFQRVKQFIFMLSNTIAISPVDQWKLCDYYFTPSYAEQYSAGYYLNTKNKDIGVSMEFYYKTTTDIPEYKNGARFNSTPHMETLALKGNGEAYGAELMLRKGKGNLSGWLAYSYSRSFIVTRSQFSGESINEGRAYPSNYDRPHTLSVVSILRLNRRFSFSSNMVFMTGRPVTYPVHRYYVDGIPFMKFSDRNAYRLPDYFRLDLSLNIEGNLKKKKLFHSHWMLNAYNLTGRQNAYSVIFKTEDGVLNSYKMSIFGQTIVTLSWNFKLGNYATE